MSANTLEAALAPLLERAKRRSERLKMLNAQPPTAERDRAIAAENRELDVVRTTVTALEKLFRGSTQQVSATAATAAQAKTKLLDAVTDASHYEQLFHTVLERAPQIAQPLPDEKWPDVCRRAQAAMFRRHHIRTSPDTYAATFGLCPNP